MPDGSGRDTLLEASAILLLVSDGPAGGTSVVIDTPTAPPFVVLGNDTEEAFARLRRGAIAYGMPETYQALPRDMVSDDHALLVVGAGFRYAQVDRSGSLFGTTDEKILMPLDPDGRPYDRVRIPIPSLDRPAYLEFELVVDSPRTADYRLAGDARFGEGYICTYCGKLCPQKEPHTAAHGVGGHVRAGAVPAGDESQDANTRQSADAQSRGARP
ncbi:MAG TPA: hypothetical protein VIG28_03750 [Leifsonia sp.]|jgi:hypothetical protein